MDSYTIFGKQSQLSKESLLNYTKEVVFQVQTYEDFREHFKFRKKIHGHPNNIST